MTSWMRNTISKLYNAVSAPVAATRDALAERLQMYVKLILYCITEWWIISSMDERDCKAS